MPSYDMPPLPAKSLDAMYDYLVRMERTMKYLFSGVLDSANLFEVGGWRVDDDQIASKTNVVGMSTAETGGDDIRFWAGNSTPGSAPYRVYESGLMVASNADITGKVTANSGAIGGWVIGTNTLSDSAGMVGMSSAVTAGIDLRFWAGDSTPGSANFKVYEDGYMEALDAYFEGEISSSLMTASTVIGSDIMTDSPGIYPRTELSTSGRLLKAEASATDYIAIYADFFGEARMQFQSPDVLSIINISGPDFVIGTSSSGQGIQITSRGDLRLLADVFDSSKQIIINSWDRFFSLGDAETLQEVIDDLDDRITALETP